uniref:BTB domain-containing protein n=1 Tax=Romanomermis culicivorax TaxID=13658 RepID=A0A915II78_ROMCU
MQQARAGGPGEILSPRSIAYRMAARNYTLDDAVTINVSGKKFFVSKSVLLADPKNRLCEIFNTKQQKGVVRPDNIYLDGDPKTFRYILHYLRCVRDKTPAIAALPCRADELTMLMSEAQALKMDKLLSMCAKMLKKYMSDETTSCEYTYVKEVIHGFEQWIAKEEGW